TIPLWFCAKTGATNRPTPAVRKKPASLRIEIPPDTLFEAVSHGTSPCALFSSTEVCGAGPRDTRRAGLPFAVLPPLSLHDARADPSPRTRRMRRPRAAAAPRGRRPRARLRAVRERRALDVRRSAPPREARRRRA